MQNISSIYYMELDGRVWVCVCVCRGGGRVGREGGSSVPVISLEHPYEFVYISKL